MTSSPPSQPSQSCSPSPTPRPTAPPTQRDRQQQQPPPPPKPIPNPRRLLILTPTSHSLPTIPPLLYSLTGVPVDPQTTTPDVGEQKGGAEATGVTVGSQEEPSTPTPTTVTERQTFAGYTTHPPLHIENRYYMADVPIWVDEIPIASSSAPNTNTTEEIVEGRTAATPTTQWKSEFSGSEAKVVRDAIGGVMICLRNEFPPSSPATAGGQAEGVGGPEDPADRDDVKAVKDFIRCIADVKKLIEEEREEDTGDIDSDGIGLRGGGDVLGVLVLVGSGLKQSSTATTGRKTDDADAGLGEDDDLDTGLGAEDPFSVSWWEDQLDDIGILDFEVVTWDPRGSAGNEERRDRYGEYQGMRRIRQILETHDWTADDTDPDQSPEGSIDDDLEESLLGLDSSRGFNLEVNELEREMLGLRMAIEHGGDVDEEDDDEQNNGEDEIKVESMEALMLRMQAIKDMSAELPEHERKRFAAKAVGDIMREL